MLQIDRTKLLGVKELSPPVTCVALRFKMFQVQGESVGSRVALQLANVSIDLPTRGAQVIYYYRAWLASAAVVVAPVDNDDDE